MQFGEFSKKDYAIFLGTKSWFFRVWMIQEYAIARRATFIYGQNEIDADKLALAITVIGLLNKNPPNLALQGANVWAQMFLCQAMDNNRDAVDARLLRSCTRNAAALPREIPIENNI
ncbi:hypothetical protein QL093DRAFT_2090978 [Fusarium oxysporum]|nr:hypothetical protein QL093DRAFT_2090978 [Fusarium oxysporum]